MTARRAVALLALFAAFGLVGPLVWWLSSGEFRQGASITAFSFVHDLVSCLWPAEPLGALAFTPGAAPVVALAVGLNVLWFTLVGAAALVARSYPALLGVYAVVAAAVAFFALRPGGFSLDAFGADALGAALVIYAVPFALTAGLGRAGRFGHAGR